MLAYFNTGGQKTNESVDWLTLPPTDLQNPDRGRVTWRTAHLIKCIQMEWNRRRNAYRQINVGLEGNCAQCCFTGDEFDPHTKEIDWICVDQPHSIYWYSNSWITEIHEFHAFFPGMTRMWLRLKGLVTKLCMDDPCQTEDLRERDKPRIILCYTFNNRRSAIFCTGR